MTRKMRRAPEAIWQKPAGLVLAALLCLAAVGAQAETIKIGLLKTVGVSPLYLGLDKGYFAAQHLDLDFVVFDSAEPVAVAAASGAIDIGATGLTAGFYNLAGQGALTMIASDSFERPGYQSQAVLVSNQAWNGGLRAFTDLPSHSVAISQIGGAPHYSLGLLADHFGFALSSVHVLPLQSNANRISAVAGGTADTAILPVTYATSSIQRGDAKLLGWVGDYVPWQVAGVFINTKTAKDRGDMINRFLIAFRQGAKDYHDAFSGPDERLQFGPTAAAAIAIIAKGIGQSAEDIRNSISYIDPNGRIDMTDIAHQIAWYRSQGMLKGTFGADAVIDERYAVPMP
ncbi:MAG TPA: ABC transporter substrate-binding protein [Xanthobacteraceae bacterium]